MQNVADFPDQRIKCGQNFSNVSAIGALTFFQTEKLERKKSASSNASILKYGLVTDCGFGKN